MLAAYEHCRSPLRYGVANRLAKEFDVCQRWIATGRLPTKYYVEIDANLAAGLKDDSLFSQVYDNDLSGYIDAHIGAIAEGMNCPEEDVNGTMASQVGASPAGTPPMEVIKNVLFRIAKLEAKRAGKTIHDFKDRLAALIDEYIPSPRKRMILANSRWPEPTSPHPGKKTEPDKSAARVAARTAQRARASKSKAPAKGTAQ